MVSFSQSISRSPPVSGAKRPSSLSQRRSSALRSASEKSRVLVTFHPKFPRAIRNDKFLWRARSSAGNFVRVVSPCRAVAHRATFQPEESNLARPDGSVAASQVTANGVLDFRLGSDSDLFVQAFSWR